MEPRVKLNVPIEESFPIPLKYIDVTRTTDTSTDVMSEKHIEDHWNVDGERELSDAWTGFTRFIVLNKKPPMDLHGPGGDWRVGGRPRGPAVCCQTGGSICLMHRNAKRSKNGHRETQTR